MVPKDMPTRLLVIGSGAIGVEFASFYSDMGADVTIVEMLDRILPVEDEEVSAFMHKQLIKQGMKIQVSASIESLAADAKGVNAGIKGKDGKATTEQFSHAVVAIGIVPNTENIGLETLGVKTERGHIVTDGYGRTNVDGVYAIGDVTGPPWLAHKASHEGVVCVERLPKQAHPFETWKSGGTFAAPGRSVGLTEARARMAAARSSRKIPVIGNGKASRLRGQGFVKDGVRTRRRRMRGAIWSVPR